MVPPSKDEADLYKYHDGDLERAQENEEHPAGEIEPRFPGK